MIAVDTNILVYAHREDSPHHSAALAVIEGLARGPAAWAVPWPCLHEFLAVVTHPRIYQPPTSPVLAMRVVESLTVLPHVHLLGEAADHASVLGSLLEQQGVLGARVHDARIAAICLSHGVAELWTADRDFSWFPALRVRNPLIDGPPSS